MHTTLNRIRSHRPCEEGWKKLLKSLNKTSADDEPLPLLTILESNGVYDAIWCLRAVEHYDAQIRLFAVRCVRQVSHRFKDPHSLKALDVAEAFANGQASLDELAAAGSAVIAAANEAYEAWDGAVESWDAAADCAAYAAAGAADADAALGAFLAAVNAVYAADDEALASGASQSKAKQAALKAQEGYLRELLCQPSR